MKHKVFPNILTNEQCDRILDISSNLELTPCKVYKPAIDEYQFSEHRQKCSSVTFGHTFYDQVLEKLIELDVVPQGSIIINKPRILKYDSGGFFKPHVDMLFDRTINGKKYMGKYNVLIWLNDDYVGGETSFFNKDDKTFTSIKGKKGDILVFDPRIMHEGEQILQGKKHIVTMQLGIQG